ncbi:hypothetical protein JXA88_18775 [Candidatus Fermentibacteria bacterium]|nr:hypothetical protein [Candidatus Fermentibacteria bacterium]
MTGLDHPRTNPDKIEVTVPAAALVIRHAQCSNGCLLMSPDVTIGGHSAIHVHARYGAVEGDVYLDPAYGSFEHRSALEIPDGSVVSFSCPNCGVSLEVVEKFCNSCSAPLFVMRLPRNGSIEGCTRKGCFAHRLEVRDLGAQVVRLCQESQMDGYL